MSGLYTNGMPVTDILPVAGARFPLDTGFAGGENPETAAISPLALATQMLYFSSNVDRATVAGSRYYKAVVISTPMSFTGIEFLVGSTGGTDNIIVELHDPAGALVATSATAGTLLGTANTWQAIPFTAASPVLPAGTYYIAIQSNGTTGKLRAYNAPGLTLSVGSATGAFGTGATIVPPITYTAGVGPIAQLYL